MRIWRNTTPEMSRKNAWKSAGENVEKQNIFFFFAFSGHFQKPKRKLSFFYTGTFSPKREIFWFSAKRCLSFPQKAKKTIHRKKEAIKRLSAAFFDFSKTFSRVFTQFAAGCGKPLQCPRISFLRFSISDSKTGSKEIRFLITSSEDMIVAWSRSKSFPILG